MELALGPGESSARFGTEAKEAPQAFAQETWSCVGSVSAAYERLERSIYESTLRVLVVFLYTQALLVVISYYWDDDVLSRRVQWQ